MHRKLGSIFGGSAVAFALSAVMLVGCGHRARVEGLHVEVGPAAAYVPRSQTAAFLVTVQRAEGFSGSVELALRNAPVGVTAGGAVDAGAEEGELLVTVGPEASLGPVVLHLVATGLASGGAVPGQEVDFVLTVLDETRPTLHLVGAAGSSPPAEIYEELVVPDDAAPWLLELVVLGGAFVLDPDGGYQHLLTIDTLEDGRLVGRSRWADHGVWTKGGAELAFASTWIDGHAFTGIRSGAEVAIEFDLHPFVGSHTTVELVFGE